MAVVLLAYCVREPPRRSSPYTSLYFIAFTERLYAVGNTMFPEPVLLAGITGMQHHSGRKLYHQNFSAYRGVHLHGRWVESGKGVLVTITS